jgi:hypothetical protein
MTSRATTGAGSIEGTNLDEGTVFAKHDVDSVDTLKETLDRASSFRGTLSTRIISLPPGGWAIFKSDGMPNTIDKLLKLYPDVPREGSPFINPSSNASLSLDPDSRIFEPLSRNQFKRLAAMFGDMVFESGRRLLLDAHNERFGGFLSALRRKVPIWSYHFHQPVGDRGLYTGVYHSLEIRFGKFKIFCL